MRNLVYIGSRGDVVHAAHVDPETGALEGLGPVADIPFANWLVKDPDRPVVYVADGSEGRVWALSTKTIRPTVLDHVETDGSGLSHIWLDPSSSTILAAGFGSGSLSSIPVKGDGRLGARTSAVTGSGSGPTARQDGPHPHGVVLDPSGRYAILADFGSDRIEVYPVEHRSGSLVLAGDAVAGSFHAPAGSGPRHLAFHPTSRILYVVYELTAEVAVFSWSPDQGELVPLQLVSADLPGFTGHRSAAEILVSDDGSRIYVSNRGDHSVVVFRVDPDNGMLEVIQRVPAGGEMPWTLAIAPGGRWLLVANLASDRVDVFEVDADTGELSPTGSSLAVPQPASFAFC